MKKPVDSESNNIAIAFSSLFFFLVGFNQRHAMGETETVWHEAMHSCSTASDEWTIKFSMNCSCFPIAIKIIIMNVSIKWINWKFAFLWFRWINDFIVWHHYACAFKRDFQHKHSPTQRKTFLFSVSFISILNYNRINEKCHLNKKIKRRKKGKTDCNIVVECLNVGIGYPVRCVFAISFRHLHTHINLNYEREKKHFIFKW